MLNKKSFLLVSICIITMVICIGCFSKKELSLNIEHKEDNKVKTAAVQPVVVPAVKEQTYDLYSASTYDLPLFSILEISKMPVKIKQTVDKLLEQAQGFYLLKSEQDKYLVILQNPVQVSDTYPRHELQIVEIMKDGSINYHSTGYAGVDGETANELSENSAWEFDDSVEPSRPLKHSLYDEKGKVKFIETWNYSEDEPIKYLMKNGDKKTISLLKETHDNDSNYRREHIFYDNEGKILMSLTVNYEAANISRLTFYNSHDLVDSMTIINEFTDGFKTKEMIYNEDYELVYIVKSNYEDGIRKEIILCDPTGEELEKISS